MIFSTLTPKAFIIQNSELDLTRSHSEFGVIIWKKLVFSVFPKFKNVTEFLKFKFDTEFYIFTKDEKNEHGLKRRGSQRLMISFFLIDFRAILMLNFHTVFVLDLYVPKGP